MAADPGNSKESDTQKQPLLLRPAGLTEWVGQLPFANAQSSLEQMAAALGSIAQAELKAARRLELLEIITQGYHRLFDAVFPPLRGTGNITFDLRRQQLLATAVQVSSLMGEGFERVLADTSGSRTLWFASAKIQAQALQRAMLFNALTELAIYSGYRNPPANLKARMLALHAETFHIKEARQDRPHGELRPEFGRSAVHLHVSTILASIVDPHRVGPNEVWRLFELLEPYAGSVPLQPEKVPAGDPHSIFAIDPQGKKRILPLALLRKGDIPPNAWYLDANPILAELEKHLKALRAREAGSADPFRWEGRDVTLLSRALAALRGAMDRETPRERTAGAVELALGISACHHGMGGPPVDVAKSAFRTTAAAPDRAPHGAKFGREDDSMKMIDPRTGGTIDVAVERSRDKPGKAGADNDTPAAVDPATAAAYRIDDWVTIDSTPRGIGVRSIDKSRRISVGVGELVGVGLNGRGRRLGIVRWLSIDDAGHYRAGIQFMEGVPEAIAVREIGPKNEPGPRRPGIALLPNREVRTPSLLVLLGTQQKSNNFVLERGGSQGPLKVRTVSLMDRTQYFERLGFELAGAGSRKPPG